MKFIPRPFITENFTVSIREIGRDIKGLRPTYTNKLWEWLVTKEIINDDFCFKSPITEPDHLRLVFILVKQPSQGGRGMDNKDVQFYLEMIFTK